MTPRKESPVRSQSKICCQPASEWTIAEHKTTALAFRPSLWSRFGLNYIRDVLSRKASAMQSVRRYTARASCVRGEFQERLVLVR
jgi:hypothetical protein